MAAARAAFEDMGAEVLLEEIARQAGVSARTLYRRFPSRDVLLAAVLEEHFAEHVEPVLLRAVADPDPRRALTTMLTEVASAFVDHRAMLALATDGGALTSDIATRYLRPLDAVLSRARRAGVVRDDVEPADIPCVVTMIVASAAAPSQRAARPGWRRYLALMLDALAPAAKSAPLPALDAEDT